MTPEQKKEQIDRLFRALNITPSIYGDYELRLTSVRRVDIDALLRSESPKKIMKHLVREVSQEVEGYAEETQKLIDSI